MKSYSDISDRLKTVEHYAAFSPDESVRVKSAHVAAVLRWVLGKDNSPDPGAVKVLFPEGEAPRYVHLSRVFGEQLE